MRLGSWAVAMIVLWEQVVQVRTPWNQTFLRYSTGEPRVVKMQLQYIRCRIGRFASSGVVLVPRRACCLPFGDTGSC